MSGYELIKGIWQERRILRIWANGIASKDAHSRRHSNIRVKAGRLVASLNRFWADMVSVAG